MNKDTMNKEHLPLTPSETEGVRGRLDGGRVALTYGDSVAGFLRLYVLRPDNDASMGAPGLCYEAVSIAKDGDDWKVAWRSDSDNLTAFLQLKQISGGLSGTFSATGEGHAIVRLVWHLPDDSEYFPFVPGFMYGDNARGGSRLATYPRLGKRRLDKPWISDEWWVRTDRSSHAVTSVIASHAVYAMGGRDVCRYRDGIVADKTGISTSSRKLGRLSFSLGFINSPFTYSVMHFAGHNHARCEGYVDFSKGEVSSDFFMLLFDHKGRQSGAASLLKRCYSLMYDPVSSSASVTDAVAAISDAVVDYGYCPEAYSFHGTLRPEQEEQGDPSPCFATGWAGGTRVAYPLLLAGHKLGNEKWLACGRDVLENIAVNGISAKTSLFYDNYDLLHRKWNNRGWWRSMLERGGHSGYVGGQICYYLLQGYSLEQSAGISRTTWFDAARGVLDHVMEVQGEDGRYGYLYSEKDGSIVDGDGFSGCWYAPAFAALYRITDDERYRWSAARAMDFYRGDVCRFNCYGGPLDVCKSPDQEGILAWIEASRMLHELTGEKRFLDDLLIGLDYEFSWKFAYNVVNELEPLKSMEWCSTGGAITSVCNSHVHPMGLPAAAGILHAAKATNDDYLWSRLADTLRWGLNCWLAYDGHYGWGKKGMICERFCYTDSLVLERFPDGSPSSTWFQAHPWASGAVLEGLAGVVLDEVREGRDWTGMLA